jgi:sodium/potassium-transporting ATPase subunit alpha
MLIKVGLTEASRIFLAEYQSKFEESKQITLAMMDAGAQKKSNKAEFESAIKGNEEIRNMKFHHMTFDQLEDALETNINNKTGLTQDQATRKLDQIGENALTEKKAMPWYLAFLKEMTGFFSLLLWFGAILCFIGYAIDSSDPSNLYLGIVLAVVVFITGCFSYYQSSKSAALMAQFKNFIPPKALVIRDGNESSIEAAKLVPGDLIRVKGGENIPADIRVIECHEMKVNNASLTGESDDLLRKVEKTADNPLETANLAFFGTACTFGSGLGVVINTGDRTVIGQIANLAQSAQTSETPLSTEIDRFIKIISAVAIILGVSFFILGIIYGYDIITNLVFAIGIIVANVPEGLLATVTVSLALTAKRMATKKVLVKNLESVETLGSTSCICSDKTGTLTQNVMTVSSLWYSGELRDASVNYQTFEQSKGEVEVDYDIKDATCAELIKTVALGTKAFFDYTPTEEIVKRKIGKMINKNPKKLSKEDYNNNKAEAERLLKEEEQNKPFQVRQTEGDASESGLIKFIQPIRDLNEVRKTYPVHSYKVKDDNGEVSTVECEIPFNSFKKYNLMIRDISYDKSKNSFLLIMKGAPERIWGRRDKIMVNGEVREKTEFWDKKFEEANSVLGKNGERVLAFANVYLPAKEYKKDSKFIMKEENKNYPMENLTFIGLVALNDPPRVYVDQSVEKCRRAGIKVIMVTGDQPVTAAAIAKKVNIISRGSKVNVDMMENGMDEDLALQNCDAVVVHGDELARKHAMEEQFEENDPEKGRFLLNWIAKKEVVFARTTPSQKLLIVDACQKAGHVVAVTGDGVNDSPAIKKANIGVAMGSGSDVAKNAADMIILDDDFSSIVNGVEEGRLIFDNLKKSIAYTLSSNIPEIAPFIMFILAQMPLPLTTVMILCIDLGTDMIPAISFAYENPELDIMLRHPRNSKRDHLVNTKLISFSYLQIGIIQASAGFYTHFVVMNDYGFKPGTLFGLALEEGTEPNSGDTYNPSLPQKGNTNFGSGEDTFDFNTDGDNHIDLRLYFFSHDASDWSECRWDDSAPKWWRENLVEDVPICYSSEALRYAQCAYLVSIVIVQWADLMICKTRNLSISQQGMKNNFANFGLIFETVLVSILCYVPWLNIALGTRMLASPHFGVPSFPFFAVIFFYDEGRKSLLRAGLDRDSGRMTGWVAQNTYY